jgi:uncharacterized protein (DUF2252 family)
MRVANGSNSLQIGLHGHAERYNAAPAIQTVEAMSGSSIVSGARTQAETSEKSTAHHDLSDGVRDRGSRATHRAELLLDGKLLRL